MNNRSAQKFLHRCACCGETETIVMAKYDLSPNLGAILDDDTTPCLHTRVIAGAAASRPDVKVAV